MLAISVIVPVYNAEKYLKRGIESLINQTFNNFEVILINDGSTDSSGEICEFFQMKYNFVKVIHKKNQGVGLARNRGIEIALGKYIMFYDADDILENDILKDMYYTIESKKVDLVISSHKDFNFVGEKIKIKRENKIKKTDIYGINNVRRNYLNLYKKGVIQAPWAKLYKREIIERRNIKFSNLRRCQDMIFNIKYYEEIESLSIIENMNYLYLVPSAEFYLNKFPKDMFEIISYVNQYIIKTLSKWEVLDSNSKEYFSGIFIRETMMCLKLCLNKNWNMNKREKEKYINNILDNKYLQENLKYKQTSKINILIKYMIKSKNYKLINMFNSLTIFYRRIIFNFNINKVDRGGE